MACSLSIRSKVVALAGGAAGRARASASGKLHRARGHGQERRNSHGADGGGLLAGGTRIDRAEAVDVSYPGFFGLMAGGEGECGVKGAR
jgi:hypothetical protein